MAKTYTPEEVKQKFDSLPQDVKALVYSSHMSSTLQAIGTKYQLHIDQVGTLEAETADVMTGFSKLEDFVTNLRESLSIEQPVAENIAKEINEGLFLKIRESMKSLQSSDPTPPSPAPQPSQLPLQTKKPEIHPADAMLSQKTVTTAPTPVIPTAAPKAESTAPQPYKADPYREPTT